MGSDRNESTYRRKGSAPPSRPNPFMPGRAGGSIPQLASVVGLGDAIDSVIAGGDAIIFGSTRDGGALSVTLLTGDARYKLYASDQEELARAVAALAEGYLPAGIPR